MKLTHAPSAPVLAIRDDVEHLFNRLLGEPVLFPKPRTFESLWTPALDFAETDKDYIVRLEVPGIPKEDLEVNLEGQVLTLTGRREFEKDEKTEEYFWREREQGRFVRTIKLPAPVVAAKVEAAYVDGVMTVRLPKIEPIAKNRIPIK